MLDYIKKKIEKIKSKRSLHEYGYDLKTFHLEDEGKIEYAQWLHPYDQPKIITQNVVDFYKAYSRPGTLVIDIGAHTGDTTLPMALANGVSGTTLGLEPNPYVFKILAKNASLNTDKTNIIPLCFAATDRDGEFEFHYSDASFCNGGNFQSLQTKKNRHKYLLKVQGRNLTNVLREEYADILGTLSLVKVDAEGYDKEVIRSIKPILLETKPFIISECNKYLNEEERSDLFHVIADMGYALYKLKTINDNLTLEIVNENFKSTLIGNAADMSNWSHFDFVAIPT
jgi:FkbM family methyltransferase